MHTRTGGQTHGQASQTGAYQLEKQLDGECTVKGSVMTLARRCSAIVSMAFLGSTPVSAGSRANPTSREEGMLASGMPGESRPLALSLPRQSGMKHRSDRAREAVGERSRDEWESGSGSRTNWEDWGDWRNWDDGHDWHDWHDWHDSGTNWDDWHAFARPTPSTLLGAVGAFGLGHLAFLRAGRERRRAREVLRA
ncbi:hypothetical protein AOQ84DRAFT_365585 [Glonium stellatum]|uniref:Uncharacterized protein n=1 Tax=Glonium stellatum TaxID=574774 RepID=A0A8E2EYH6_9PEZI|nr:hypothetical protein AOQ84DRAFT_365585 [Glonium stellatum]